jgi:hypothetical protein
MDSEQLGCSVTKTALQVHAQHEEQLLQERRAFQALEAECLAAHAVKEGLEGRFIEEWARFAPSF